MTPQERLAQLREVGLTPGDIDKLLAIAEAVPERLKRGHNDSCQFNLLTVMRCTCGHDKLAAAWAALGDE